MSRDDAPRLDPAQVARFTALARGLCELCDRPDPLEPEEEVRAAAELLAGLCAEALRLPDVEPTDRDHARPWIGAPRGLHAIRALPPYSEVFNAFDLDEEPVTATVAADLEDIRRDLLGGLVILEGGAPDDVRDAVWEWRFGFESHWGEHATGALRALYLWLRR